MLPIPSAAKLPVRARGVALKPPVKDSPLVTKAYCPFKLATLNLPTGGGGLTIPFPLHAALQKAPAATSIKRRRLIAHLAALPFVLALAQKPGSSKSLSCCAQRRLARPSAQYGPRSRCCHQELVFHRQCARYPQDSIQGDRPGELLRCRDEHRPAPKTFEELYGRPWEECQRLSRILRLCREGSFRGSGYKSAVVAHPVEWPAARVPTGQTLERSQAQEFPI